MMGAMDRSRRWVRTALLAGAAFAGGAISTRAADAVLSEGDAAYKTLAVFARALHYIQTSWAGDLDDATLIRGAIRGMVSGLDKHSKYMDPAEYAALRRDPAEVFGGVGLRLARRGTALVIAEASENAPAARAGLRAGDAIVEVEGIPTFELAPEDVELKLRGRPGTQVALMVHRAERNGPEPLVLLREQLRDPSVRAELLEPGYGYLQIRTFADTTSREVREALEQLSAARPLQGLIVDLRDNSGGLLEQAVRVADVWIAGGIIVTTRAKGRDPEVQRAHPRGTEPSYPLAVLINGRSASASEVLAGALQDHGRALLVGTSSYGKASVQTVLELEDQSALKLTIARYETPKGRWIEGSGLTPDLVVGPSVGDASSDAQLRAALQVVRSPAGSLSGPKARGISKP